MVKMLVRGDKHVVKVSDNMLQKGWYGGQWVRYVGNRTVDFATKTSFAGFMLWGYKLKDLDANQLQFIETTAGAEFIPWQYENKSVEANGIATLICDSGEMYFNKYAFDTTQVYSYQEKLFVNDNAVLTNVDVGAPTAGFVISAPQDNNDWLGMILQY